MLCNVSLNQVSLQMKLLLEACSDGGKIRGFVPAVWGAIIDRLAADEKLTNEEVTREIGHETLEDEVGDEAAKDDGWEECKDQEKYEQIQRKQRMASKARPVASTGQRPSLDGVQIALKTTKLGTTDVALAASGERQLRVSGTFRRAIRASVSSLPSSQFPWI